MGRNEDLLPMDEGSLKRAVFAAIEGGGFVYDLLARSIGFPTTNGEHFAQWLLGKGDGSRIRDTARPFLMNLARVATVEWCEARKLGERLVFLVRGIPVPVEREVHAPRLPAGALERCIRIGQWPLTLSDQNRFVIDDDRSSVSVSLPLYYALLNDRVTFETLCTQDAELPKIHPDLRREVYFMLMKYYRADAKHLFESDVQRLTFLAQARRWLTSCHDLIDHPRDLRSQPDSEVARLCSVGYTEAAYELGWRGVELPEKLDPGSEADVKRSWAQGIVVWASRRMPVPAGRVDSRPDFYTDVTGETAVYWAAKLRMFHDEGVVIIDPSTPFAKGRTVPAFDGDEVVPGVSAVSVDFEGALAYLREEGKK